MNQLLSSVPFLKTLKDGLRGAMLTLSALIMSGMTGASNWPTVIGGIVSALLGVLATSIRSYSVKASDWVKILNDFAYGFLIAAQSILQAGLSSEMKIGYILGGLGVAALGVGANVLNDDYKPQTATMKIVKDMFISIANALGPVLHTGIAAGNSLGMLAAAAGHIFLSVGANTLEHDLFGTDGQPTKPVEVKP